MRVNRPSSQAMHVPEELLLHSPLPHIKHIASLLCATMSVACPIKNLPATHDVQNVADDRLHFPGLQMVQFAEPSVLALPALHGAHVLVGVGDDVPAAHGVHNIPPVFSRVSVTEPAGQFWHALVDTAEY